MSCFKDDRATLNEQAENFENGLRGSGLDAVLQNAFQQGMNLDEIMYVLNTYTEKTVRRYIVQEQLKKAANKEKV